MPLPLPGKTAWPPALLDVPHADMDRWHAWYSGDTDHLAAAYGAAGAMSTNPTARAFFDRNRPAVRGAEPRMFWGQDPAPGQVAAKLHIPIAADIAELSANLLWADVPTISVDRDSTDRAAKTEAQVKRYLDDRGHATMREGAEIDSGLGGVYYRVVWDREVQERPWSDVLYPDAVVPEWRWRRLVAATVWRELEPLKQGEVWRLLERHEPGSITYGLYRGDLDTLGERMGLRDHPDSEYLVARTDDEGRQDTQVPRLLLSYVPNILPNRVWRGIPGAESLGRSDFAGLEGPMDALDEGWTSWMRDLRHGKSKLLIPQSWLDTSGPGSGGVLNIDEEVVVKLNTLGGDDDPLTSVQFKIRVEEHERTCKALRRQILSSAGYSAQSFGEEGVVAQTATEVAARKEESLTTRGLKLLYQRPALVEHLTTMLMVDFIHCGANMIDPGAELTAVWPRAVQPDPEAVARSLSLLESAGAISTYMKVKLREPEWDESEVLAEVRRIREDQSGGVPAGDPYGTGGGVDDEEPDEAEVESEGGTEAGADEGLDDEQRGGGLPAVVAV
ncbi:hypothetical protein [Streptomyces sp. NPDC047097]|uniref:hypothetical protein n=1 Tax=Streptomyces sp. NPDC047097 TaxID=3155260 RepID=UPI0033EF6AD2